MSPIEQAAQKIAESMVSAGFDVGRVVLAESALRMARWLLHRAREHAFQADLDPDACERCWVVKMQDLEALL